MVYEKSMAAAYTRTQSDQPETSEHKYHKQVHEVPPLWRSALGKVIYTLASAAWPTCGGEGFACNSAYTNALSYGDSMFQHQDATSLTKYIDRDIFVTALIYPNPSWHVDWGGETVFYDGAPRRTAATAPPPPPHRGARPAQARASTRRAR
jgi:hypothetical protein